MRRTLRFSILIMICGLLAIPQADARGGGRGGAAGHAGGSFARGGAFRGIAGLHGGLQGGASFNNRGGGASGFDFDRPTRGSAFDFEQSGEREFRFQGGAFGFPPAVRPSVVRNPSVAGDGDRSAVALPAE